MQQFNEVIVIMEENIILQENMIVIRDPKTFFFNFAWPKDVDQNLKHAIKFIINECNKSLAENKIKNEIKRLLLKYNAGNNIHEHGKQQNERTT